jgi:hypothetical protein
MLLSSITCMIYEQIPIVMEEDAISGKLLSFRSIVSLVEMFLIEKTYYSI